MSIHTRLESAAIRGDVITTRRLLHEEGVDVNTKLSFGTALHRAVYRNHSELIQFLLKSGADVNTKDCYGRTPLCHSLGSQRAELKTIQLLVGHNADVTASDDEGKTALHFALVRGAGHEVVRVLLAHNADVTVCDEDGYAALRVAIGAGSSLDVVQLLIDHKANIHTPNSYGMTPLHDALRIGSSVEIVQLLINHNADVNAIAKGGETGLHFAVEAGADLEVVQLLIDHDVDVNGVVAFDKTPLHLLAEREVIRSEEASTSVSVLKLLLSQNANIHAKDIYLQTPLHEFVRSDNTEAVEALFIHLGLANQDGQAGVVEAVLLCTENSRGRLPIHYVRSSAMAKILLEQRVTADTQLPQLCHVMLTAKDCAGQTVFDIARRPLFPNALVEYLASYRDLPLMVSAAAPLTHRDKRQRCCHEDNVAVHINPMLNEFHQCAIAIPVIAHNWWIPLEQNRTTTAGSVTEDDDNTQQFLLPVELKFTIMSYLSVVDAVKIQATST